MEIKKVVWASILGAISVVIDIVFKLLIPVNTIGIPFYAIPIVIAAIFLGPKYSIAIAFLGDLVTVLLVGQTPLPLYSLASTMWGIIPGILFRKKHNFSWILLVIFITHLAVTLTNSFAYYIHFSGYNLKATLVTLPFRAAMIIPNSLVIALLTEATLEPIKIKTNYFSHN